MRLTSSQAQAVVLLFAFLLALFTYFFIYGDGYASVLFLNFDRALLAKSLAIIVFGLYCRLCYIPPILPNEQGIQLFLGSQTGEVWSEGNFLFVPWPFWSIWKRVSIQHFTFTFAAENRTKEGHRMMVFATGRAIPNNVQRLVKISQQGLQEQLLALATTALGSYINENPRDTLLRYQSWDISRFIGETLKSNHFYGLDVTIHTTKAVEISTAIAKQFDLTAIAHEMEETIARLKRQFPSMSDVELYAMYAAFVGQTPQVMSYIVNGNNPNTMILGKGPN